METFERLLADSTAEYAQHIRSNPLFALVAQGHATRRQYAVYLRETYHLVRHTSRALALAASRVDDERRELRAWLLEQACDEHGHELFCLKDLRHLGVAAESFTAALPGAGAWGVVTQNYFIASYGEPAAFLGVASVTEGMGAELAGDLAATLTQRYGIPESATTFLRSHAGFDRRHLQEARSAINRLLRGEHDYQRVLHARRMTLRYYGELFREVAGAETLAVEVAAPLAA